MNNFQFFLNGILVVKKVCLFVTFSLIVSNSMKAQSVSYISYEYTEVLSVSIEYSYSTNGYYSCYSPVGFYDYALSTLQARYDYYHDVISTEYYKLSNFKLINKYNNSTIQQYKNERLAWVYNAGSTWDLGNVNNSTNIINYCTELYSYPTIKSEINLLKECYYEIVRLKYEYPDSYHTTIRYQSISKMLEYLKTCPISQISSLHWLNFENGQNYTVTKPSLMNVVLISQYPDEGSVYKNGYFKKENNNVSFHFAMYDKSNNQYISSSFGTIGEVTELELESVDDGSIVYDYSFNWSFNNSYNSDTGVCKVNISLYPATSTFFLRMKNINTNEIWEFSGVYQKN